MTQVAKSTSTKISFCRFRTICNETEPELSAEIIMWLYGFRKTEARYIFSYIEAHHPERAEKIKIKIQEKFNINFFSPAENNRSIKKVFEVSQEKLMPLQATVSVDCWQQICQTFEN